MSETSQRAMIPCILGSVYARRARKLGQGRRKRRWVRYPEAFKEKMVPMRSDPVPISATAWSEELGVPPLGPKNSKEKVEQTCEYAP